MLGNLRKTLVRRLSGSNVRLGEKSFAHARAEAYPAVQRLITRHKSRRVDQLFPVKRERS
jgi:hypothetical protein